MSEFFIEIGHNLALLLSLTLIFHLLRQALPKARRLSNVLLGAIFGVVAVYCMLTAYVYEAGVIFDGRSIIVALAALFGGGTAAGVAVAIAGTYRVLVGGIGVWAGLATLLAAAAGGLAARALIRRGNWPPTPLQLWGTGLGVHLLVLGCMFLLPAPLRLEIAEKLALPFLLIYPPVLVLLGLVMAREEDWASSLTRLQHAEWLFNEAQKVTRFGSWEYHLAVDRLAVTEPFRALLGLPADMADLSLQDLFGRLHRDDWDAVRLAFDAAIAGRSEIDVQARLTTDDGRNLWIRLVGKSVAVKGKTAQLVGNLIDITRRKQVEMELRGSEARLQAILDHAPALICICDLEGRVILANRLFGALGEPAAGMVGRPLYELLPRGGALEQWLDDLLTLQAGGRVEFEEVLWHADGSVHTYLTSKFLLAAEEGRGASLCYIATDISDLRRTIAERQKLTEELTAKNTELERFTYSVSHDLKAPLLTMGSYSELLAEDLAAGNAAQVAEDLEHIGRAVRTMRQLIDDLLELSRIGRTVGTLVPVDLNEVTADALLLLDGELRDSGARIVTAPDLPTVSGDAARLRQVMQNLLQNALKFRQPGRPQRIDIGWQPASADALLVTVSDTGCGIAAADLERVFDLFAHGGGSGAGTGVGLALVRRIMEQHHGRVWAESAGPGAGATFFLRFPGPGVRPEAVETAPDAG